MSAKTETIDARCKPCGGTGLFIPRVDEGSGTGKICTVCQGNGHVLIEYEPYTGNGKPKVRNDVKVVVEYQPSRQMPGTSATLRPISYADFLRGARPGNKAKAPVQIHDPFFNGNTLRRSSRSHSHFQSRQR